MVGVGNAGAFKCWLCRRRGSLSDLSWLGLGAKIRTAPRTRCSNVVPRPDGLDGADAGGCGDVPCSSHGLDRVAAKKREITEAMLNFHWPNATSP